MLGGATVVTVYVIDLNEHPVVQDTHSRSIGELADLLATVDFPVSESAFDENHNRVLTYEVISQTKTGVFGIDSQNGQLFVRQPLNYEEFEYLT